MYVSVLRRLPLWINVGAGTLEISLPVVVSDEIFLRNFLVD